MKTKLEDIDFVQGKNSEKKKIENIHKNAEPNLSC